MRLYKQETFRWTEATFPEQVDIKDLQRITLYNKTCLCNKNLLNPLSSCLAVSLVSKEAAVSPPARPPPTAPLICAVNLESTCLAVAHKRSASISPPAVTPAPNPAGCLTPACHHVGCSKAATLLQIWAGSLSQPASSLWVWSTSLLAKEVSKSLPTLP